MKFKYKRLIFTASASIMLLGMIVFSTKNASTGSKQKTSTASSSAITASMSASGAAVSGGGIGNASSSLLANDGTTASSSAVATSTLLKDAYPEVNNLISSYFKAIVSGDMNALGKTIDSIDYVDQDELKKKSKDIESISNVVCYTLDGPDKGAHMVYAYNEVKIKGIKTAASSLDGFYVKPDKDGKLKIVEGPVDEDVQAILNADIKRDDVKAILSEVNTKLAKEIKNDSDLKTYYKDLGNSLSSESSKKSTTDKSSKSDKSSKKSTKKSTKKTKKKSIKKSTKKTGRKSGKKSKS